MNEHIASSIDQQLEKVAALIPSDKARYAFARKIKKELLPRAIMSYADSISISGKGPAIAKILADNGLPGTYGSMKVFFTKARDLAEANGVTENKEQAGLAFYIKEKIGDAAEAELMKIAVSIVDAAPRYVKQKRMRKESPAATEVLAPSVSVSAVREVSDAQTEDREKQKLDEYL
jgi:hypothetical protein